MTKDNYYFFKKTTYFVLFARRMFHIKANGKEYMKITACKLSFKRYDVSGQGVHVMPICEHLLERTNKQLKCKGNVQ